MTEDIGTEIIKTNDELKTEKRKLFWIKILLWVFITFSIGSLVYIPIIVQSLTGSINYTFFSFFFSAFIPIFTIPTIGDILLEIGNKIEKRIEDKLPPHKYDENIKFWEPLDIIKVVFEHSRKRRLKFIGFTDDGSVILVKNIKNISKKNIESGNFNCEDFDEVEEYNLQDFNNYKNITYEKRNERMEDKRKLMKVKTSKYNETLSDLRELEQRKMNALQEIYDEESSLEELDRELKKSIEE